MHPCAHHRKWLECPLTRVIGRDITAQQSLRDSRFSTELTAISDAMIIEHRQRRIQTVVLRAPWRRQGDTGRLGPSKVSVLMHGYAGDDKL